MSLLKGTNSYIKLSEADSYFADRLDATAWDTATFEKQEQALVTATRTLDELHWQGSAVSASQALAFPRTGAFRDDSRGFRLAFTSSYTYSASDEVEATLDRDIRLIRQATYELAFHLLTNGGVLNSTGEITDIKVGPIVLTDITAPPRIPRVVTRVIEPMLRNAGNSWWGY